MSDDLFIRWEVDGISKLTSTLRFSPYHRHNNLPWRLIVCTEKSSRTHNVNHLGIYISFDDESESELWICEQSTTITLINQRNETNNLTKVVNATIKPKDVGWGRPEFIEFTKLLEPSEGFVKSGKIIVEARTTVKAIHSVRKVDALDFNNPSPNADNVALKVDDGVVHVCRKYISFHSPYFASLFFSNAMEENTGEIELKDVSSKDLEELLNLIYPSERPINYDSYKQILKLGHRFQIERAMDLAERYLMHAKRVTTAEKLYLSEEYGLESLMAHCLNSINTLPEIKKLESEKVYAQYPANLKISLLNKAFQLIKQDEQN